ncbi:MAG: esterase-like activity of phytase family protein [Brevundimonas sp.]
MIALRRSLTVLALLALTACASVTALPPVAAPLPGWTVGAAGTRPVGLGLPFGATLADGVRFAGGVEIVLDDTSPLHSLSDLKLTGDGEGFVSVSDAGDLVRGDLVLNSHGRLTGVTGLQHRRLTLLDGQPITEKRDGDAEGLAITPSGDVLVSFERDHRIWNYGPADRLRTTPVVLPRPDFAFTNNDGMEGIALTHAARCDEATVACLRAAGESGGVWDCFTRSCAVVTPPPPTPLTDADFRITGLDRDPSGQGWFVLQRSFRAPADVRAQIRRMAPDGTLGPVLVALKFPGTTDNFEGLAAVARDGGTRLYILSDDNTSKKQRTLLLAFDVATRTPSRS